MTSYTGFVTANAIMARRVAQHRYYTNQFAGAIMTQACRGFSADLDCFDRALDSLSALEWQRLERKLDPLRRRRQHAAYALVRACLGDLLGRPPAALCIQRDRWGKPWIEGLHFNLSHCGRHALLVVAPWPVGVDLEAQIERRRHALAAKILDADEWARWQSLPEDRQAPALTRAWVRKEAALKALGIGLRLPPRKLPIEAAVDGSGWQARSGSGEVLRIADLPAVAGHAAAWARCQPGELPELVIETLD